MMDIVWCVVCGVRWAVSGSALHPAVQRPPETLNDQCLFAHSRCTVLLV